MFTNYTGILIRKVPQTGNGFILKVYTKEAGIKSFFVRKTKQSKAALMPLAIIQLSAYKNDKKQVLNVKEFGVATPYNDLYSDITKSNIALFINELLDKLLLEEENNEPLFKFIAKSLLTFDREPLNLDFHLVFLMKLSDYLGVKPNVSSGSYFDIENGATTSAIPSHVNYFNEMETELFKDLFMHCFNDKSFTNSNTKRKRLIELLIQYYNYHFEVKNIKSLPILEVIFS